MLGHDIGFLELPLILLPTVCLRDGNSCGCERAAHCFVNDIEVVRARVVDRFGRFSK